MDTHFTRDLLMTAAIFSFFSFVWFGWAQERPPAGAVISLGIGSGIGLLLALAFGLLSWRNWAAPTALDPSGDSWRSYLIIVGVEVVLVAAAVAATVVAVRSELQPSFLTGILAGPILLTFAIFAAAQWLTTLGQSTAA
ncbi:hypothetical protein [Arthrobacter sp. E3]|uniref:hypothetical protein n=1 Tax=Arthrobacter sp. E3 TaxID=517402 RepID=UPI001A943DF7|nr:hypothetical protein [Arthrobacter sp. E3]